MAQITLNSTGVASNGTLALQSNGTTTAVTIDASQNVGIGTASPAYKFDLVGQSRVTMGGSPFAFLMRYDSSSAPFIIGSPSANAMSFSNSEGTERMRIDSSGNVGIGTSSNLASSKLDVRGRIRTGSGNSSGDAELIFSNYASATTAWDVSVRQDVGGANNDLKFLRFDSSGTYQGVAMQIDSAGGNLLVGTTSGAGRVRIQKAAGAADGIIMLADSGGSGYSFTGSASTGTPAYFSTSSGQAGLISVSGNTTSYTSGSDYRLKENIRPLANALEKVANLKPVAFEWKTSGSYSESFLAHELAESFPFAVIGEKDAVNEDGSIKPQGIDTSFLVATLTAAIQELKAIVDAQAVEIAALKGTA